MTTGPRAHVIANAINAGNIADAALEINNCFSSAQNAAEQYLNEIKAIREETDGAGLTLQAANSFVGGMNNRAYHSNCIVFGEGLYTQFGNTFVLVSVL